MGKKHRRNKHHDEDEDETEEKDHQETNLNFKDLNFQERRELQRKQAAQKRKAKQKCYLCGKAGHVRRECPGIQDDGRGMSRYKGKSDPAQEKQNYRAKKDAKNHKGEHHQPWVSDIAFPQGFEHPKEDDELEMEILPPPIFFDPHCKMLESIEYMRFRRGGKTKISEKEALEEYQAILDHASEVTNFSGMILTSSVQNNRPWINTCSLSCEKVSILFVIELATNVPCSSDEEAKAAKQRLLETITENQEIIGLYASLDYTEIAKGNNSNSKSKDAQLSRLKASLHAASQAQLPIQIELSPGVPHNLQPGDSVAGTEYAEVLLDFQATLTDVMDASSCSNPFQVHLIGWQGRADHTMSLLKAFPSLYIGLDASVTFAKANHLHEIAFDIPVSKLILETSNIIPSHVTKSLGRQASPHSVWWPFLAQAVSERKKSVNVRDLTEGITENILRLYPKLAEKCDATS